MKLPRERDISAQEFLTRYVHPRRPAIVADEVPRWPAYGAWTWQGLVDRLGTCEVDVFDDWFEPTGRMTFADFVAGAIGVKGSWRLRYVRWFSAADGATTPIDDVFTALRNDWALPRFLPDTGYVVPRAEPPARVDPTTDPFPYRGLFVSAAGARTRLHLDPWTSSAVLCQVVGDKRVRMWPPEQHGKLLEPSRRGASADDCGVTPTYDDTVHRGEALFIPGGWWHEVDTLTDAIAVTWNFVPVGHGPDLAEFVAAAPNDPELAVLRAALAVGGPGGTWSDIVAAALATAEPSTARTLR